MKKWERMTLLRCIPCEVFSQRRKYASFYHSSDFDLNGLHPKSNPADGASRHSGGTGHFYTRIASRYH
jgi:hypothetical protein